MSRTAAAPVRLSRLPIVPARIASVESPAMVGPVTVVPAVVMVSWPSFSASDISRISRSMWFVATCVMRGRRTRALVDDNGGIVPLLEVVNA